MGKLVYGALQRELTIEDRLLWHLEALTITRLRRATPFALRWIDLDNTPRTVWIHANSDLYFEYDAPHEDLDRELLEQMARAADRGAVELQQGASSFSTAALVFEVDD